MINMKILIKCGGELEHDIKGRWVEPCSTEDYINAMEDIIARTGIGKTWTRNPMESKMALMISREDKRTARTVLKLNEEVQCSEEKEESYQDSAISLNTPVEDYSIGNITDLFEVSEVHNHLPQYSEECYNLINIQDSRMCKTKPAKGKGYTAGGSCITSILINDFEAKVSLDTGEFCTCVGKDYLQATLPEWKIHPLPIEGVKSSSSSSNIYPLGILHTLQEV
ncbi:hypothetical protein O181_000086 [Austropuccinia psidii MF-1]|uniref:Uncharacterized protein n=1 Tax=Austropuccinia psidii MF-1 TaxID=1389203 RepID=A0A9Q3B889_9BASI|nr:hypothetical protein [Austropuccinia psidii MF-1]